jgi:hypothetical protein
MHYEELSDIVEFSIGLAGFSAVVTVFLQRSRKLSPIDRFRTINLLLLALTPAFFVFLRNGVTSVTEDGASAARYSSAVFAIWLGCVLLFIYRARRQMPAEHEGALNNRIFVSMYAAGIALILALGASVAFSFEYVYSVFYFGLVLMLVFAVIQFIRILIGERVEDDA